MKFTFLLSLLKVSKLLHLKLVNNVISVLRDCSLPICLMKRKLLPTNLVEEGVEAEEAVVEENEDEVDVEEEIVDVVEETEDEEEEVEEIVVSEEVEVEEAVETVVVEVEVEVEVSKSHPLFRCILPDASVTMPRDIQ